jgi:hypothetical protein
MQKDIVIVETTVDFHDCEYCGSFYEESTIVRYKDWSYGDYATAYCYGNVSTEAKEGLAELIKYLGLPELKINKQKGFLDRYDFFDYLEKNGFKVETIEPEEDPYDYSRYDDDYDDDYSYNYDEDDEDLEEYD